jgi:hypothetical protein
VTDTAELLPRVQAFDLLSIHVVEQQGKGCGEILSGLLHCFIVMAPGEELDHAPELIPHRRRSTVAKQRVLGKEEVDAVVVSMGDIVGLLSAVCDVLGLEVAKESMPG